MRPLLVLAIAITVSIVPWVNPIASGPSAGVLPWLISAVCLAILSVLRPVPISQWVMIGWLIAALLSAGMGFIQYTGATDHFSGWIIPTKTGEAFANLRQRNQFASLTNLGLLALICWLQHPTFRSNSRRTWIVLSAIA